MKNDAIARTVIGLMLVTGLGEAARAGDRPSFAAAVGKARSTDFTEASVRAWEKFRAEDRRYKGLTVTAGRNALGDEVEVPPGVRQTLERLDFIPDARKRFAWIEDEMGGLIVGWQATVIASRPVPNGFIVDLQVYPRHTNTGFTATRDFLIERYEVIGQRIRFLGAEGPPTRGPLIY